MDTTADFMKLTTIVHVINTIQVWLLNLSNEE